LLYLNKPAFLVPIKNSHQEINADIVKDSFEVLDESARQNWIQRINDYKKCFQNKDYPRQKDIQKKLGKYYESILELDKKSN